MTRHDLIIDFETLGVDSRKCVAANCSTLIFDWGRFESNPYTYDELLSMVTFYKLDAADQISNYKHTVDNATIKFWKEQPKELRKMVLPSKDDLTVKQFANQILSDLTNSPKIEYWWSRNNTFDPVVLYHLVSNLDLKMRLNEHLSHWRVRDTRTWIDAKFDFTTPSGFDPTNDEEGWKKKFVLHDSRHDVVGDVLRLQVIKRSELGLEWFNVLQ